MHNALIEQKLFWALSRIRVEILRLPRWGEVIQIETWPCRLVGPFFRRDFIIYNSKNEVLCRGVSGWLLLNSENMRPQRGRQIGDRTAI